MRTLVRSGAAACRRLVAAGLSLAWAAMALAPAADAQFEPSFTIHSPHVILVDYESGTVLFERDADVPRPPASLAKLMTMELVFYEIKNGDLQLDEELVVSENAWRRGGAPARGSTMFAEIHSRISVENLIQGAVVQSGNDACIVFAEAIAGNEDLFARMMNARAHELGLSSAEFRNSTGLHAPGQVISARDLARLAAHLIRAYPEFYRYYGQRDFTWNKIFQRNRNPLLGLDIGADGLKTGFIRESGYGLVGSAVQEGRRLIVVINGAATEKQRADDARRLLEWGFRNFDGRLLFRDGATVAEARVFGGERTRVPLHAKGPVYLLSPLLEADKFIARVYYEGPLRPPVRQGDEVARLRILRGDQIALDIPLYAGADVEQGSLMRRAFDSTTEYAVGLVRTGINSVLKKSAR